MDLDRNLNTDGKGKYAVINLRKIPTNPQTPEELAAAILANPECVEFGRVGDPDEFFLIKLKDQYAQGTLMQYAHEASSDEEFEYSKQVHDLALRSGVNNPHCKKPD